MVGRFVSLLGVALVAAAGLMLAWVVIGKLAGWSFDLVMPSVVAGAAAVLGSSIVAMMGRWTERQAAI